MRWLVAVVPALLLFVMGCGGGSAPPPRAPSASTQEIGTGGGRPRSILEILGPHGQHQSAAQLADIAALIRRWEQDPYGPLPENDTTMSRDRLAPRAASLGPRPRDRGRPRPS